jgi:hypothetical protein
MANTFKVVNVNAPAATAALYTVPASTTAIILQLQAANVGSGAHPVNATVVDTTASRTTYLAKALSVPHKAAVGLIAGKQVLETTDVLAVWSDAVSQIDVTVSILEIT